MGDAGPGKGEEGSGSSEKVQFRPPYKPRLRSGGVAGGMSGTLNPTSLQQVYRAILNEFNHRPFEMIDIGAASGVVLACAFAFGAMKCSGIELKNEGHDQVTMNTLCQLTTFTKSIITIEVSFPSLTRFWLWEKRSCQE